MIFYSSDKPNPHLRSFVEEHAGRQRSSLKKTRYTVGEFHHTIETTKNSPIYGLHPYHLGKKPHDAVDAYIRHYTTTGDLVLDPFCGSGSTAVAAVAAGRWAVAIDASPAATFISRFYLASSDPVDLKHRFASMLDTAKPDLEFLYRTICHRCGGPATIHYLIYSNIYACPVCGAQISLYEALARHPRGCRCRCGGARISSRNEILGYNPVAVCFSCAGSCRPRRSIRSVVGTAEEQRAFEEIDLASLSELERIPVPYRVPRAFMMHVMDPSEPWGDEWRPSRNFRKVTDLFTHRNLWALAALFHAAGMDDDLRAVLTAGMFAVSRKAQHLDGGGGYIPGTWALPPMSKQRNVEESLKRVFTRIFRGKQALRPLIASGNACISTQSATSLAQIPDESIDYIFTDPPYGGVVQYAELNFVWEAWLGLSTEWHNHEIIVNKTRGKSDMFWADMMRQAMGECHRVLKPDRWLSLCYHDTSPAGWRLIREIMTDAGFVPGDCPRATTIDTGSRTYNQRMHDKLVKRDLVVNFRKPRSRSYSVPASTATSSAEFLDRALGVIREFLKENPGATKDRIYDHLVSAMVRSGRIQAHNFDRLLQKAAEPDGKGAGRWFVKGST
ncbi:MAG: hypothetical protein LDL33_03820 [Desulfomonile sp.]|nr:hypothetical protein [Desulfomonile sp.]